MATAENSFLMGHPSQYVVSLEANRHSSTEGLLPKNYKILNKLTIIYKMVVIRLPVLQEWMKL